LSTPTEEPQKRDDPPRPAPFTVSDRTANRLITVVAAMWVLNVVAGMIKVLEYEPSQYVHGAFMIVLGGVFTVRVRG
jgi:hypothetical protein